MKYFLFILDGTKGIKLPAWYGSLAECVNMQRKFELNTVRFLGNQPITIPRRYLIEKVGA